MKLLAIGLIFILASGCVSMMVQNPTLHDLSGTWESTGPLSYLRLSVGENDPGVMAIIFDESSVKLYRIDSFQSLEQKFKIKLVDINGEEKPFFLEGHFVLGRLALNNILEPEEILWFIRSDDLSKYQKMAIDEINKLQ